MNDLQIIIQAILNKDSLPTIEKQLKELKLKYGDMTIDVKIDKSVLDTLSKFNSNINQVTDSLNKEISSINKQTEATNKAIQAEKTWREERQKTVKDGTGIPKSVTTTYGNNVDNTKQTVSSLPDGSVRQIVDTTNALKDIKDYEKILDQAYKQNVDFDKKVEDLDKVHYQALKTNAERVEAQDKQHYVALKQNRDIDLREQQAFQKQAESLDKAHYQALKTDQDRMEAQDKQHYIALQKNAQMDLASQKKAAADTAQLLSTQNKSEREVINLQRRYGTGDSNVDNTQLASLLGQLKGLTTASADYKTESARLSNEISKIGASAKSSTGSVINFGDALKSAIIRLPTFMLAGLALREVFSFFSNGIKYVNEFNATLTQISTAVNYNQAKVNELGKTYQALGVQMGATSKEVAAGALEFYRQGLGDEEVLKRLTLTTEYAKISGLEFKQSAELLTAASTSMHTDITKVSDVFTLLGKQHCPLVA